MESEDEAGSGNNNRKIDGKINGIPPKKAAIFSHFRPLTDVMNEEKSISFIKISESNGEWLRKGSTDLLRNISSTRGRAGDKSGERT